MGTFLQSLSQNLCFSWIHSTTKQIRFLCFANRHCLEYRKNLVVSSFLLLRPQPSCSWGYVDSPFTPFQANLCCCWTVLYSSTVLYLSSVVTHTLCRIILAFRRDTRNTVRGRFMSVPHGSVQNWIRAPISMMCLFCRWVLSTDSREPCRLHQDYAKSVPVSRNSNLALDWRVLIRPDVMGDFPMYLYAVHQNAFLDVWLALKTYSWFPGIL